MDKFAGVHVEAGIEEGAVTKAFIRVGLDDLAEVELAAGLALTPCSPGERLADIKWQLDHLLACSKKALS